MSTRAPAAAGDGGEGRPTSGARQHLSTLRDYGVVLTFVLLFGSLAVASSAFLTVHNLQNVLNQQAPILIMASAGTLVIIAGGFDVSVGATYALAGVVAAWVAIHVDAGLGLGAGVLTGLVMGIANGLIVTAGRINTLIATLSTAFIIRGLALVLTGGHVILVDNQTFALLGQESVAGVKIAVAAMVAFVAAAWFVLTRTVFGRFVFAAGGNAEAARLSGVRVDLIRASTFALSGLSAGLGGTIAASRFATGQADVGTGLEFTVIAGIVVGGTSILGGEGAIWRTVMGVLFIALIGNGFVLLTLDPIYQQILTGAIILAAVAVDARSRWTG